MSSFSQTETLATGGPFPPLGRARVPTGQAESERVSGGRVGRERSHRKRGEILTQRHGGTKEEGGMEFLEGERPRGPGGEQEE